MNVPVRVKNLGHMFAEDINILVVSHGDVSSIISGYNACPTIDVFAFISDPILVIMRGKNNLVIADQVVCPKLSLTPPGKQLRIMII